MKYEAPKGWNIAYNPKPVPAFLGVDYDYWHDDYDGENGLAGSAGSVKECWEEIANIEI